MLSSRLRLRARRKRSGAKPRRGERANPGACPQHAGRAWVQRRVRVGSPALQRPCAQRVLLGRAGVRSSRRLHSPCGLRFHALRIPVRCLARRGPSCLGRPCNVHRAPGASACCHHRAGLHNRGGRGPFRTHQQRRSAAAHRLPHARRVKIAGITLRSKNHNLAEALEELESESTGRAARSNVERPASPNGRRTANAECFAGPDGSHAPNDASAASPSKRRIAKLNASIITTRPGNSRTAPPSTSGAANSRAGAAGLFAGAADQALANPPRPAAFACLTEREWEVARLVAEGLDNREIAAEAYLSEGTVRNNISNILSKMSLKNRTQIAVTFWKSREN